MNFLLDSAGVKFLGDGEWQRRKQGLRGLSLAALSGMTYDLSTAGGRMMATMIAGLAECEQDLLGERVRSGLAVAKAHGKILDRKPGQRPKAD